MEQPDREQIEEMLPRYYDGKLTREERRQVEAWMAESDANRRIARQVHLLCLATDTLNVKRKVDTEKALNRVRGRMAAGKTSWWTWAQRVAAVLFVPLAVALLVQYANLSAGPAQMVEIRTNPGVTTSVVLPDSTVVCLNSGSSLSYPSRFEGDTREVALKGEAYFDVAKDKKKKFIVSAAHRSKIEVLGTRFNVEAYEDDENISTTLVEGKVCFLYETRSRVGKKIVMQPGQKLVYNPAEDNVQLYATSGVAETAWKDGKIIFRNTPLPEALRMLEKRFDVDFVISSKRLVGNSFTGTFTNQRLERILEYFKISSKIRWRYLDSADIRDERSKIEIYENR